MSPGGCPKDHAFLWTVSVNRMLTWESYPSPLLASSTPGSRGQTETFASTLVIPRPCEMIVDVHAVEAFKLHPLSALPLTLSALFSLRKVSS